MRFLIELDGPIFDIAEAWYGAHRAAAAAVGWSTLDRATFWRLTRTAGADAVFLPGARPPKLAAYAAAFAKAAEEGNTIDAFQPQSAVAEDLRSLRRFGSIVGVTLGGNIGARRQLLDRLRFTDVIPRAERLSADPRRRPTELRALAEGDARTIVLAATDTLVRSAEAAGLFCVGIACGPCTSVRLQRASPNFTTSNLSHFAAELTSGGVELVRAGLAPFSQDA